MEVAFAAKERIVTNSTPDDHQPSVPNLRLLDPQGEDAVDEDIEPLTPEMIESLARLRKRLHEALFAPGFSTRDSWPSIAPGN